MENNVFKYNRDVLEAEKGIIASIFYYFSEVSDLVNIDSIPVDIFVTLPTKRIFNTLKSTTPTGGNYDPIIVYDNLKNSCLNEKELNDCSNYLANLPRDIHYFSISKYLNLLHENKVKKELDALAKRIISTNLNSDNFSDKVENWRFNFEKIIGQSSSTNYSDSKQAIENFQNLAAEASKSTKTSFLKTCYRDLDKKIKALCAGQLVVIASRPGVGKTTFGINLICNNLANIELGGGTKEPAIGIFSLEMTTPSLLEKLIAIDASLELNTVQKILEGSSINDVDRELIELSQTKIAKCNLLFCDEANITIGKIVSTIKTWAKLHDLKFVIIDYLQLINVPDDRSNSNMNQYQKIGVISRSLKILSMELNICIVALAQLNRKSEERKGAEKIPILSDLRESGSIEQDADIVMFLYEEKVSEESDEMPNTILKIAKNRHGPVGNVEFKFDKTRGLYKLAN